MGSTIFVVFLIGKGPAGAELYRRSPDVYFHSDSHHRHWTSHRDGPLYDTAAKQGVRCVTMADLFKGGRDQLSQVHRVSCYLGPTKIYHIFRRGFYDALPPVLLQ